MSALAALAVAIAAGRIALRFRHPPEMAMAAILLTVALIINIAERTP